MSLKNEDETKSSKDTMLHQTGIKGGNKMTFLLKIKPSINPRVRHKIEDVLKDSGYEIHGSGQHTDGTSSDITFSWAHDEDCKGAKDDLLNK